MRSSKVIRLTILLGTVYQISTILSKQLRVNKNGVFKFVQFTDIHFGEGAENDLGSQNVMRKVLETEQPDFVAATGDVISGYAWDGIQTNWFAEQYKTFVKPLYEYNTSWAYTCGNHDDQGDLTRDEISEVDRSYNLSLTQPNAANISHTFNYILPVYDYEGKNILFRLWFMDSGEDQDCMGVSGYDCVRPDQIEWFRSMNKAIPDDDPSKGKGFLLVHIPLFEYINLYNNDLFYGARGEEVSCQALNTGLFAALKEQKTVEWVLVGHDHDNDFYGNYDGINLSFGRKTGHGSYGPLNMQQGARVFEITTNPYKISTWVRQEDGTIHKEVNTNSKPTSEVSQTKCGGSLGKADHVAQNYEEMKYLRDYYLKRHDLKHLVVE
ncbi:UNKNOWN [Stylonychia lemnae]|uniref:Calcineurin-like phosphoesterase domain-containing protein n=1 Tax=Stylonychia lemnae TaxID=5949 RepID=A0A078ACG7_STYLE|nr:UNKNOWN [Stylonychia lemnae]|eukprot:CDW79940.1 UNKNOWN [Stylonychia lemnae]